MNAEPKRSGSPARPSPLFRQTPDDGPITTLRQVKDRSQDKLLQDEEVSESLVCLFTELLRNDMKNQRELLRLLPESKHNIYTNVESETQDAPGTVMLNTLGFVTERKCSSLQLAGTGVFVVRGRAQKGSVVAMYPGTIYQADEPIFFQSIRNPFVFRCIDGILIDGNDKAMSKIVFRSCSGRDRLGPFSLSDSSWLTPHPVNPLAVGQYVNNCSNEKAANVCYQEYDVPDGFPLELRQFLPNSVKIAENLPGPTGKHYKELFRVFVLSEKDTKINRSCFKTKQKKWS
ncbi:unnamed protein product [Leuciscus chuanchicus]